MIATEPPSLAAWLASARSALVFDAYTLIDVLGGMARWIDADFDFVVPDAVPRSFVRGPIFQRGTVKQSVGLSVDTLSFTMYPQARGGVVMFGSQTLLAAAQTGTLRGATLQLERLVFDAETSAYQGRWVEFAGTLAVKNTAGGIIKTDVLSELNLLNKPMPADVYQGQCKNQVFDSDCGLARSAWQITGAVNALVTGITARSNFGSALGQGAGWFNQGTVRFTTGANTGIKRTVKNFSSGAFSFFLPWPNAIALTDSFVALPGCNRSLDGGGCAKFNNRARYRGEPFIPQPETVA